jgi:hypothetical protein
MTLTQCTDWKGILGEGINYRKWEIEVRMEEGTEK